MKKVNVEMKRNEINEVAKALEIKFVGVKTIDLVEAINKKVEESKAPKVKPTLESVGFKEGDYVVIDGSQLSGRSKKLDGRHAMVNQITQRGMLRVTLVNPKNGQLQGCQIPMPITSVTKIETQIMVVA